ncbi:zinc-binding protein A33-like [Sphaeramia orbicularis]|uniref:zinc-binding protein A33-like n=1 Tax=Sphaeramia orbicularis TaxID=375764 RepID=UPI00117DBB8D|nr:zinc-binding protein A33-like [Sphaeramia orbicularis]
MKHITPFTPVTLDPRTAGRTLQVSHGLHSILTMPGSTQKESHGVPVPANPERFHPMSSVLSREGFNSGVHSWDIEVGDTDNWTTGVAVHSISRQIAFEACPEAGLWCICLRNGEYLALTTPSHTLNLEGSRHLTRIHVKLNWDEGWLDFKNADTNGSIFTFRHRFEERVYPYFESISTSGILSLVAQKVSVSLDHDYMEDAAITNEVQATKSNSAATDITTAPTNSEMSESREGGEEKKEKKSQKSTMKSQFVKRKPTAARVKTSENKSDVKKQTSKNRFSDNYHISLFRAMKLTNKETSKEK